MEGILFWICGAMMLLGGVMMILQRSAVISAVWLVTAFVFAAGIFAVLGGPFLAIMQVLVYAGAIMVLFLFVIMMLQGPVLGSERKLMPVALWPMVAVAPAAVLVLVVRYLKSGSTVAFSGPAPEGFGTVENVARLLLGKYLCGFELISIVLLVAIIGALAIGQGERKLPWK